MNYQFCNYFKVTIVHRVWNGLEFRQELALAFSNAAREVLMITSLFVKALRCVVPVRLAWGHRPL